MNRIKILLFIGLALLSVFVATGQDPAWVKENTWVFKNFTLKDVNMTKMDWNAFRDTYVGVAPSEIESANFDIVFYEALYKNLLFDSGHCFGIDVLAMMMKKYGGYYGYCHPPYIYAPQPPPMSKDSSGPKDPDLVRTIQLVHGNQMTHGFLMFLLDLFAKRKNRDGNYALGQLQYFLAKDDPCVISITKELAPGGGGGHVVVPYAVDETSSPKRIYVYDPNRSYYRPGSEGKDFYENHLNYIEISGSGAWKFIMAGTLGVWQGDPGSGGNIMVVPLSVTGKKDRLPQSLFADAATAINSIFIFGQDACLEQITSIGNSEGMNSGTIGKMGNKQYYLPNTEQLDTSDVYGMHTILPFIPLNGGKQTNPDTKVWFFKDDQPLSITVRSHSDNQYAIALLGVRSFIKVSGHGEGIIRLKAEGYGTESARYTLTNVGRTAEYHIELQTIPTATDLRSVKRMDRVLLGGESYVIEAGTQENLKVPLESE